MIGLQIFTEPGGEILADWTAVVEELEMAKAGSGDWYLSGFIPLSVEEAALWYSDNKPFYVVLSPRIWSGALEAIRLVGEGFEFRALGHWRAMSHINYNAMWSLDGPAAWRIVNQKDIANANPSRFYIDFSNRIYITANKNEVLSSSHWGGVGYRRPNGTHKTIDRVTFDYSFAAPSSAQWQGGLIQRNDDYSHAGVTLWNVTGSGIGTILTGSVDVSVSGGAQGLTFWLVYLTASTYTVTEETGEIFLEITNLRLYGRDGLEIRGDHIVTDLAAQASSANPRLLNSSPHLIENSVLDLRNEQYEDRTPADIAKRLAAIGDDQGRVWEVGADYDRYIYFRPRGSGGKRLYVYVEDFASEKAFESFYNAAYATYKEASGDVLRTGYALGPTLANDGLRRETFTTADTTSLAQAEKQRDTALADGQLAEPIEGIEVTAVYDEFGADLYPLWLVKPGDQILLRNVPIDLGFVIDSTVFSFGDGTTEPILKIEPREPTRALDFLLTREEAGIR